MNPHRRRASAALLVLAAVGLPLPAAAVPRAIEVWKAAGCGCCEEWLVPLVLLHSDFDRFMRLACTAGPMCTGRRAASSAEPARR